MLHALVLAAAVAATPPAPTQWVTDGAGFLSEPARAALDAKLEGYEHATGHQVIVWIGTSIDGADLADWAVHTFAAWKIGRKGQDDGVAMFVLAGDKQIDIEVGYGLEDKIPDAIASRIIRDVMTPKLRANDRDGAVTSGVDAILESIEGHPWQGAPATMTAAPAQSPWTWGVGGVVLIGLLILSITHPRMAMFLMWTFMGRGGGFGGGGFGDGGGGGFGGGGGRSGGGGARGGW